MSRALTLAVALFGLVLLGLAARSGPLLALALPPLAYLAASLATPPARPQIRAERTLATDRAAPEAAVPVRLTLTNDGPAPLDVRAADQLPPGLEVTDGETALTARLAPGESVELHYTVRGGRGLYRFRAVTVGTADAFGLVERATDAPAPGQLFVLPPLVRLRRLNIRPRRTRNNAGLIPARSGGPGIEFFGVREYQPGDPTRWVNARVTARHEDALFVNEFEQERVADVGIIVDARKSSDATGGSEALFEYAVTAAAALATALLERGNRVGLLVYGRALEWTFPGYGRVQRERLLRALARAAQGDHIAFENLDNLPTRQFPSRSQIILVSALQLKDVATISRLRARGYEVLVICPDPVAFERRGLPAGPETDLASRAVRLERAMLLRRVRAVGAQVVEWDVAEPFEQLAERALGR